MFNFCAASAGRTAAFSALIVSVILWGNAPARAQVLDKTVATVKLTKTENISQQQLDQQYSLLEKQTGKTLTQDEKKEVLESIINDALVLQAAESGASPVSITEQQVDQAIAMQRQSLGTPISDADFRQWVKSQLGIEWNDFRKKIKNVLTQQQYIALKYSKELQDVQKPTEKNIQDFYDQYATNFTNPAMVRISHLFWDTRNAATQEARNAIQKKAFDTAAAINQKTALFDEYYKKSVDDASYIGEDLGYIIRDPQSEKILGTEFLDKVFSMSANQVSGAIVSKSGYHVVKVTDKRTPKLLQLADPILPGQKVTVKERINDILLNNNQQQKLLELIQTEVAELRKKATIKYFVKNP